MHIFGGYFDEICIFLEVTYHFELNTQAATSYSPYPNQSYRQS